MSKIIRMLKINLKALCWEWVCSADRKHLIYAQILKAWVECIRIDKGGFSPPDFFSGFTESLGTRSAR
ncbi:hypothetical protein OQZ33_04190 [Pedobacter sp. MC2016-05]|nr:hypothetical protein [Pedobacter sp. MC2016-05]